MIIRAIFAPVCSWVLVLAGLVPIQRLCAVESAAARPNIILILAVDQG